MSNCYRLSCGFVGALLLTALIGPRSFATIVSLPADRDNSIMQTTFVQSGQQLNDVNLGGGNVTQVGAAGGTGLTGEVRTINSFDPSPIPLGSTINAITLRMFYFGGVSDISGSTPFTIEVHSISAANANWVEGTGTGAGGPADNSGSNWNFKNEPAVAGWAGTNGLKTPGVDYDVTVEASQTFNVLPGAAGTPINFTFTGSSAQLTTLVNGWYTTNPGFVLFNPNAALLGENKRILLYSSDDANSAFHPQLIVDFTAPSVPEPSTFALFGLGVIGLAVKNRRRRTKA